MIADKGKGDLYAIYSIWLREMLRFFRLKSRLSSWHFWGLALTISAEFLEFPKE